MKEHTTKLVADDDRLQQEIPEPAGQAGESPFRFLIEQMTDGVAIIRDRIIVFVNPALISMLAVTSEQLLSQSAVDLFHENDKAAAGEWLTQLEDSIPAQHLQARCVTGKKQNIWIEGCPSLIRWEGEPAVLVTMRDITERKLREIALEREKEQLRQENSAFNAIIKDRHRSSETIIRQLSEQLQREISARERSERAGIRQSRLLVEQISDGVVIIRNNTLVFVNTALTTMLGVTSEQLLGKTPVDLFHENHKTHAEEWFAQLESSFPEQSLQAPCVTGEGQEIWTEGCPSLITWEGEPAILVTIRDISEQKLREIELEEETRHLEQENLNLRTISKERYRFGQIIGKSLAMQEMYELLAHAAASDFYVAIYGESGTGKELVAQTVHAMSDRHEQAFVTVNCGAIPETLFESEFFGHRKGAFTGAYSDKRGYFEAAHNGTLFLDEVGELNPLMQVKLLRALENGEYTPVGEHRARKADVRVVAATNKDLKDLVQRELMRQDFFYRIHVVTITVPPLRNRKEDLPLLIEHFLTRYSRDKQPATLPGRILEAMYTYDWPGNIRELQNELQRYLTTRRLEFIQTLTTEPGTGSEAFDESFGQQGLGIQEAVEAFEKRLILKTLEQQGGHKGKTAEMLHINPKTLYKKMKKHQITS